MVKKVYICAIAASLLLVGCGGGGGGSSSSSTQSSAAGEGIQSSSGGGSSGGGSSSSSSSSLTDKYTTQIEGGNIIVGGSTLSGYSVSMTPYPSGSASLKLKKSFNPHYAFVRYVEPLPAIRKEESSGGFKIASILPKYTEEHKNYARNASSQNSYGIGDSDYLVLVTISGGIFSDSDSTPLQGKLYAIIPESFLARGDKPYISELSTYAAMTMMRANPSTKEAALEALQTVAKSYFAEDPSSGGEASFNSFNNFNPNIKTALKDENVYDVLVAQTKTAIITGDTAALNSVFENDKDKDGVIAAIGTCDDTNYEQDGYKGRDCFDTRSELYKYMLSDKDGDFIPDDVEIALGMNPNNWDENNNDIADGIDPAFDPYYKNQWHLRSTGILTNNINNVKTIVGNDLDLLEVQRSYMGYNGGNYIAVQIVDSGVEAAHEDLSPNMDLSLSRNAMHEANATLYPDQNNPTPTKAVNDTTEAGAPMGVGHGSACAGIIAARGFNAKGVRGIAPFAKISGSNWLEYQSISALEAIWLVPDKADLNITVSNNSWGNKVGNYDHETTLAYDAILNKGASLRSGKGRVYLFAAGNSRENNRDANLDAPASHKYSITVAALDYNNSYAPYSNPGANLWLSGYAGSYYQETPTIATTLLTDKSKRIGVDSMNTHSAPTFYDDDSKSYTFGFNGTSAATPTVSGALALVLEACPTLTQRDVKYLSAITAKKIDARNSSWITNKAGIKHSRDYGFGLVNAKAMIEKCKDNYTLLSAEDNASVSMEDVAVTIPAGTTKTQTFDISKNLKIEYVYIWHDINTTVSGSEALEMDLTSPSGTTMPIIRELSDDSSIDFTSGMRFGAAGFLDENSSGTWKLMIKNKSQSSPMSFEDIGLEIFGR